jgi:hypothetical protein
MFLCHSCVHTLSSPEGLGVLYNEREVVGGVLGFLVPASLNNLRPSTHKSLNQSLQKNILSRQVVPESVSLDSGA